AVMACPTKKPALHVCASRKELVCSSPVAAAIHAEKSHAMAELSCARLACAQQNTNAVNRILFIAGSSSDEAGVVSLPGSLDKPLEHRAMPYTTAAFRGVCLPRREWGLERIG